MTDSFCRKVYFHSRVSFKFAVLFMISAILKLIDFVYYPFRRIIPVEMYRYVICGSANLGFDIVLYFIFYNFIFVKQNVDLDLVVLSPHIASLFVVFPITFTTGFLLNRFITFPQSNLQWSVQLFRYLMVAMGALVINYLMLKLLVDVLGFYPTPSRLITIIVTVGYSFLSQKKYSFKIV